jgi:hypothetical protein
MSWYHRLNELGFPFGTFPNSKGLWQSAGDTAGIIECFYTYTVLLLLSCIEVFCYFHYCVVVMLIIVPV